MEFSGNECIAFIVRRCGCLTLGHCRHTGLRPLPTLAKITIHLSQLRLEPSLGDHPAPRPDLPLRVPGAAPRASRETTPATQDQELLLLAIDASVTHLFQQGMRAHTVTALNAGPAPGEVMEVLELTSVLGVHAIDVGVPLLTKVLVEEGLGEEEVDEM
jgi:hypothetical protein